MFKTIRVSETDGVTTITLNRPDVMNALSQEMRSELTEALVAAHGGRGIVLTGEGRAFCSGQYLTEAGADLDVETVLRDQYVPMLMAITEAPVPVIAAVNGVAAGAGANIALVCDVVIAAESASFIQVFTRIGLIPDAGGTHVLPRLVGLARAMGAALFAEKISARQAADWGMIWQAVPDGEFEATVAARAAQLASGPTVAYRALKTALNGCFERDMDAQLALEAELQGRCAATDDFREGVAAFLARRPPQFSGQ